jgi:hypothetical protein
MFAFKSGGTIVSRRRFARQHPIQPFPARYGLRRRRMSDQASTELRMVVLRCPGLRIVQVRGNWTCSPPPRCVTACASSSS